MLRTLSTVGLWALLGWLGGAWAGPAAGWAVFSLGLLVMVGVATAHLSRIRAWVRDLDQAPPAALGPWDDVLAPIYRRLSRNRRQIETLSGNLHSIMEAARALPQGAITLNAAMEVTWCNPGASEHIGLNPEVDRGHSIFNILRAPSFARYARQADWSEPLLLHVAHDGRERALEIALTPYGTHEFLLVTRDVTQIEKLETMRKDFVANVSHELRTPLTILSGFLETLRETPAEQLDARRRADYLALMSEQAERMQALVSDLLTLSALESTPAGPGAPVSMASLIQDQLNQARALSGKRHTFVVNVAPDLDLRGMAKELGSAVGNLLTNAVRYTSEGGIITVSWFETEDGSACFSVQDNGVGIAAHEISRLTERFYRTGRGRARVSGGTGLGLAITKHIALRHDAELTIQSRLGSGSLFSLIFPSARVLNTASEHPQKNGGHDQIAQEFAEGHVEDAGPERKPQPAGDGAQGIADAGQP